MSASERFVQQQEEYMRISKEHKAARGSIVNFDETHELIKAMRNTFTSRRTMCVPFELEINAIRYV